MEHHEAKQILDAAYRTDYTLGTYVDKFASFCVGRLRKVSSHTLARLKRELRDFNIHTGEWK